MGENTIVAAMAFVKAGAQIPPHSLAVGSPAKVMRELSADEIAWKRRGTAIYQRLALEARDRLRPATPLAAPAPDRRCTSAPAHDPLALERARFSERP